MRGWGIIGAVQQGPAVPEFSGDPYNHFDIVLPPTDALVGIEIDADGGIEWFDSGGNNGDTGRWDGNATLNKADYQFRLDTSVGSINWGPSDSTDIWLPASAGLNVWAVEETGIGISTFSGTLRVRLAVAPFTEFDTASVMLQAEATP